MSESDSGRDSPSFRPKSITRHPKLVDNDRNTNLHYLAAKNDVNGVISYLEHESSVVDPENFMGWTPLMMACRKGHLDTVKVLLSYGGNATNNNRFGMNVFQITVVSGNLELVAYMLEYFLTGGISRRVIESNFSTIALSVLFRHQDVLDFLIKKRFQIDMQTKLTGITPLMFAHAIENDQAITILLEKKADATIKNFLNHTAMDIATIRQQMKHINTDIRILPVTQPSTLQVEDATEKQNERLRSMLQLKPNQNNPPVLSPVYSPHVPVIVLNSNTPMSVGFNGLPNHLISVNKSPCHLGLFSNVSPLITNGSGQFFFPQNFSSNQLNANNQDHIRKSSNLSAYHLGMFPNISPITPLLCNGSGQIFFPPDFASNQINTNMSPQEFNSNSQHGDFLNARINSSASADVFLSSSVINVMSPVM